MVSGGSPYVIDSDNALGSPFGDVDDAFALATLFKAGAPVEAVSSVFGNTFEPWAFRNNQAIARLSGFRGRLLRGASTWWARRSEVGDFLAESKTRRRVIALGPLTNVALALFRNPDLHRTVDSVIFTGSNFTHCLPATRFFDFNFWKDPRAARTVFASSLPLTCVPCDVARGLRFGASDLADLEDALGLHLRRHSARWFLRARVLKVSATVPIWDLVAALYALHPEKFETRDTTAVITPRGRVRYGEGTRAIRVVVGFDAAELCRLFFTIMA